MQRKVSAHERQWEKVKKGEWSSGKKWADDAPKEVLDADSISLISSGAAGAFVHGLEDEYMGKKVKMHARILQEILICLVFNS